MEKMMTTSPDRKWANDIAEKIVSKRSDCKSIVSDGLVSEIFSELIDAERRGYERGQAHGR